jgi:hypothetical protein
MNAIEGEKMTLYKPRTPRKSMRQTVIDNRTQIDAMCKLMGAPKMEFSEMFKPLKKRAESVKSIHPTEAQVLKSVLSYLRHDPRIGWCMRVNSGVFQDGDRFISSNSQRGCSDIIGMLRGGRMFAIEVKSHAGKLMPHQDQFLTLIRDAGGLSGVARCIEDVDVILF